MKKAQYILHTAASVSFLKCTLIVIFFLKKFNDSLSSTNWLSFSFIKPLYYHDSLDKIICLKRYTRPLYIIVLTFSVIALTMPFFFFFFLLFSWLSGFHNLVRFTLCLKSQPLCFYLWSDISLGRISWSFQYLSVLSCGAVPYLWELLYSIWYVYHITFPPFTRF